MNAVYRDLPHSQSRFVHLAQLDMVVQCHLHLYIAVKDKPKEIILKKYLKAIEL